jgi:hypothetical protein
MIGMELRGAEQAVAHLGRMVLNPQKQRRLLQRMGRAVVTATRLRVRRQKDVAGRDFTRRKRAPNRTMIRRITRHLRLAVERDRVTIYIGSGRVGTVARQLQEGVTQQVTARQAQRQSERSAAGKKGPSATRKQARRLRELGFRKSQKWLMDTFTAKQAGYVIRKIEEREPQAAWTITLPARAFLGVSTQDRPELGRLILAELRKAA